MIVIMKRLTYIFKRIFSMDYKSEYFEDFIKRILSRYSQEKDKRNIILLGDLTKKIIGESSFTIIEDKKEFSQPTGILVNPKKNQIKVYYKYLEKVLKTILKTIKNYNIGEDCHLFLTPSIFTSGKLPTVLEEN